MTVEAEMAFRGGSIAEGDDGDGVRTSQRGMSGDKVHVYLNLVEFMVS